MQNVPRFEAKPWDVFAKFRFGIPDFKISNVGTQQKSKWETLECGAAKL